MSIARRFKNYFLRGLAVLLPSILTIAILVWGYKFIQENIGMRINNWLVDLTMLIQGLDRTDFEARQWLETFWLHGLGSVAGFIIALIAVCIVGVLLASVVGRSLWRLIERFLTGIPVIKQVYPYVKQITDFLFQQQNREELFSRVVAVEYPRKGIWSVGMATSSGPKKVSDITGKDYLAVLMPTSPTPFTGFIIMVPKEEAIDLDMSIDEAFRFIVSAGVITPSVKVDKYGALTLRPEGIESDKQQ
ncbi:MAG: DUF502 domain-containing protein [Planctomycetota bacterium]|jgi:uncharacterized membrane protein